MAVMRVKTGLEVLLEVLAAKDFAPLQGKNVGLITNPTSILPDLTSGIDALLRAPGVRLRALFGPEHGVRGDVPAGTYIESGKDTLSGLPVFSLYGKTRVPTPAMLSGLDALVFDLQDIGARSYTYVSTLGAVMEGAARRKIPVFVLDRPNPVGLSRVEGGPTQTGFVSFVSKYPIAARHGMTLGEIARMINGKNWLPDNLRCDLHVVLCENLTRSMATWNDFGGLPWVPTSPHIPNPDSPLFYAATGITGELATVSIGVGWPQPFALAGAPDMAPNALSGELNRRVRAGVLPGFRFRPATWTPYYGTYKGQNCGGVQIYLTDPANAPLSRFNTELLDVMRTLKPKRAFFTGGEETRMFDLGCGTDHVRKVFLAGASADVVWAAFNEGRDRFVQERKPFLLYP